MKVQFDGHCYLRYHKEANISLIDVDDKDGLLKSELLQSELVNFERIMEHEYKILRFRKRF